MTTTTLSHRYLTTSKKLPRKKKPLAHERFKLFNRANNRKWHLAPAETII